MQYTDYITNKGTFQSSSAVHVSKPHEVHVSNQVTFQTLISARLKPLCIYKYTFQTILSCTRIVYCVGRNHDFGWDTTKNNFKHISEALYDVQKLEGLEKNVNDLRRAR